MGTSAGGDLPDCVDGKNSYDDLAAQAYYRRAHTSLADRIREFDWGALIFALIIAGVVVAVATFVFLLAAASLWLIEDAYGQGADDLYYPPSLRPTWSGA